MKRKNYLITGIIILMIIACLGTTVFCWIPPKKSVLKPVIHPKGAGVVEMVFEFELADWFEDKYNKNVEITIGGSKNVILPSQLTEYVNFKKGKTYSKRFNVEIPPNDTCDVTVTVNGKVFLYKDYTFFVTKEDTVEIWKGKPEKRIEVTPINQVRDIPEEKLDNIYRVQVTIESDKDLELLDKIIGLENIGKEVKPNIYRFLTTYRKANEMGRNSINFIYIEGSPEREHWYNIDSVLNSPPDDPRSDLNLNPNDCELSIGTVDGELSPGVVRYDVPVTFTFWMQNYSSSLRRAEPFLI